MSYLVDHWSFGPFGVVAVVVAVWYEIGLWRLGRRSRSAWFYAGLVVALIAVQSPIGYWSYDYFFVHMVQHLLLMFAAPSLIVAGAPWRALSAVLSAVGLRFPVRPAPPAWVAIGLFNAVMIVWHLPGPFDLAEHNDAIHLWLMEGSFLAAGILFWLQYIPSPPFRRRLPLISQAMGLLVTNLVMIGLAMALSIFASHSIYSAYSAHIPGVTLPAFADQQIGAAILWVCGDFWAVPTMIAIVRELVDADGGVGVALDRVLHRGSASVQSGWASRGSTLTLRTDRPESP
jgi:putative membrane protein